MKPPRFRRRPNLIDQLAEDLRRRDETPGPPIDLRPRLHPIVHASVN